MDERDVCQLGEDCPLLERLEIAVVRSQGNITEAGVYRALGRHLPRLRHLSLYLDFRVSERPPAKLVPKQRHGRDTSSLNIQRRLLVQGPTIRGGSCSSANPEDPVF
ncbi:hypothetical protein B0T14DRAFT_83737 [Immersiella caudata]|uniref:Uncharacterized protein n=1 Tax=Immersiella caudata TaxID=314043 RepID=A0AA39XHQ6_9PEZI|nr:hypothetical protein B0T14DRAFT_83737 [Immersiella caudata]